jgi:hypothetical protein
MPARLRTGDLIPQTGIYRVNHKAHRLPREVILLRSGRFPRCARCGAPVIFELINANPSVFFYQPFRIYELPVLEDGDGSAG